MKKLKINTGFTLIEILIVIGIIAILAAIVIVAINPAKQFAQARNTQREAGVNTVLNAIGQRLADNRGIFAGIFTVGGTTYTCGPLPAAAVGVATENVDNTMAADTTTETGNLKCLTPTYVSTLPLDPDSTYAISPYTGYDVGVDPTGRVTVCAHRSTSETSIPGAPLICVTR